MPLPNSLNQEKFIELMEELGSHSLYYPNDFVAWLAECGLPAGVASDEKGIVIEEITIPLSTPEWGEPGISPLGVVAAVFRLSTGDDARSKATGRGFIFSSVLGQLAKHWGLPERHK